MFGLPWSHILAVRDGYPVNTHGMAQSIGADAGYASTGAFEYLAEHADLYVATSSGHHGGLLYDLPARRNMPPNNTAIRNHSL